MATGQCHGTTYGIRYVPLADQSLVSRALNPQGPQSGRAPPLLAEEGTRQTTEAKTQPIFASARCSHLDPAFDKPGLRPGMRQRQGCARRPRAAVQLPGWRLGPPAGHCPHSGRLANFTKDSTTSWVQQPRDGTRGCRVGSPPWPCHPAEGDEPREQTAPWRPHGHCAHTVPPPKAAEKTRSTPAELTR